MAGWAGWGAGPAGAGSAGGPSRWFLGVLALVAVAIAAALLRDRHHLESLVAFGAAAYFTLRAAGLLGARRGQR